MTAEDKDPIQSINERLDARKLIEAMGFRTDKMIILGGTLKTPCMIHKDERFSTLLVQPKKNTCKCMVSSCEAAREMTLVELVSLFTGKKGLEAAFEAARMSGIELDQSLKGRATGEHLEDVKKALDRGKIDAARESLRRAEELDPESFSVVLMAAKVAEKDGAAREAAERYGVAARILRKKGERGKAEKLLRDEALRVDPENETVLMELAESVTDEKAARDVLLKVADLREARGKHEMNVTLFERLGPAMDEQPKLRVRYGKALEAARRPDRAVEQYDRAAAGIGDSDTNAAIEVAEALARLKPNERARREKLVELFVRAGRSVDANTVLSQMGMESLKKKDVDEAEKLFRRIIQSDAGSISAHEGMAEVFSAKGMKKEEAQERLALAKSFGETGLDDQAVEEATKARELDPENPEVHQLLAEALATSGNAAAASAEFIEAGRCLLTANDEAKAAKIFERVIALLPDDADVRNQIAASYAGTNRIATAMETWTAAAERWLAEKRAADALEFCKRGLQADPTHVPLQSVRVRSLMTLGRINEAFAEYGTLPEEVGAEVAKTLKAAEVEKALGGKTDDVAGGMLLADALLREGKNVEALANFRRVAERREGDPSLRKRAAARVIELAPKDNAARVRYAGLLEEIGDREGALAAYEQAADIADKADDVLTAQACYRAAIALRDDREEPRQALIAMFTRLKENEKLRNEVFAFADWCRAQARDQAALSALQKLVKTLPLDLAATERLADAHKISGNEGAALDAFIKLALRLEEAKEWKKAAEALQRALALAPARLDLREKRAAMLDASGAAPNALEEWHACIKALFEANDATHAVELVEKCERVADWEFLQTLYRLLAANGQSERALEGARAFLDRHGAEKERALQAAVCEFGLELAPEETELRTRLVDLCEKLGRTEDAVTHGLALAQTRIAQGAIPAAERLLRKLKDTAPKDKRPKQMLVDLYEKSEDFEKAGVLLMSLSEDALAEAKPDDAVGYLERATTLCPGNREIGRAHAECLHEMGRTDDAIREFARLARVIAAGPDPLEAKPLFDRLLKIAPNDAAIGQEYLEFLHAIGATESASQHAQNLAQRALDRGDTTQGVEMAKRAASMAPLAGDFQIQIAGMLADRGQADDAVELLLAAVRAQIDKAKPEGALDVLEWGLKRYPGRLELLRARVEAEVSSGKDAAAVQTLLRIADVVFESGNPAEAERAWKEVLEVDKDNRAARRGLAEVLRHNKERRGEAARYLREIALLADPNADKKELREVYEQLLELDGEQVEVRAQLARVCLDLGDNAAAREEFGKLGKSYRTKGDRKLAIENYQKAIELDPENPVMLRAMIELAREEKKPELVAEYSLKLASVFEKAGAFADAVSVAEGIAESDPDNIDARLLLASYFVRDGRKDRALGVYIDAAEKVATTGDTGKAREVLAQLEKLQPLGPKAHEASGKVYLALHNETEALIHLMLSVKMYRTDKEPHQALRVTELILANTTADAETLELRASLYEEMGKKKEAIAEYEKLAARREKNPEDLARTLEALLKLEPGRPDLRKQAIDTYKKLKRGEDAARHLLDQAEMLSSAPTGTKKAMEATVQAMEVAPELPRVHELLASLHEKSGDKQAATNEYLWLIRNQADKKAFEKALRAIEAAEALLPGNGEIAIERARVLEKKGDIAGAARAYVTAGGVYREAGDKAQAAALLKQAADLAPDDVGLRAHMAAEMLAAGRKKDAIDEYLGAMEAYLKKGLVEEAQKLFEKLLETEAKNENARARGAELYKQSDIPELAAQQYAELAKLAAADQRHDESKSWAQKALAIKPRDLDAREALANAHKSLGEIAEACETLRMLGDALREVNAYEKAAKVYESLKGMAPAAVDVAEALISVYNGLGKTKEAGEEMLRLAKMHRQVKDAGRAAAVLERLVEMQPNEPSARIEYDEALKESQGGAKRIPNLLALARLCRQKGDFEEASTRYRQAIRIDPADANVRNDYIDALIKQGDNAEALRQTQEVVRVLLEMGAHRDASTVLQKVQRIGEGNADFHLAQAQVHKSRNARGMALMDLEKAQKLYKAAGDKEKMIEVLKTSLELDAQNLETRRELANSLAELKRIPEAVEQQMLLAAGYKERGLGDLAENEYRAVTKLDPDCEKAWYALFEARLSYGDERDLQEEYLRFADVLMRRDNMNEALHFISKSIRLNPWSILAREKYIEGYQRVGEEADLCEDYLVLADLYVAAGRVDDGIKLYSKVMSIDPENKKARDRLSETQARAKAGKPQQRRIENPPTERPHETKSPRSTQSKGKPAPPQKDPSGTSQRGVPAGASGTKSGSGAQSGGPGAAASFLADEVDSMDAEEERVALGQVAANYREILAVNPQNAGVRVKLADILERMGKTDEAVTELISASETMFQKGEMAPCIALCERILKVRPTDQKVRLRLTQACNKRDAMKALESAIWFDDDNPEGNAGSQGALPPKKPSPPPSKPSGPRHSGTKKKPR